MFPMKQVVRTQEYDARVFVPTVFGGIHVRGHDVEASVFAAQDVRVAALVGSIAGFTVSVIANYILSFKFVFERKEDLNKKVEFITFVVLSLIGMLLNSFLIWIVVGPIYRGSTALQQHIGYNLIYTIAKVFATAVVMVYNFITRKIFLEKK